MGIYENVGENKKKNDGQMTRKKKRSDSMKVRCCFSIDSYTLSVGKPTHSIRKTPRALESFPKTKHNDLSGELAKIFQNKLKIVLHRMLKVQVVLLPRTL